MLVEANRRSLPFVVNRLQCVKLLMTSFRDIGDLKSSRAITGVNQCGYYRSRRVARALGFIGRAIAALTSAVGCYGLFWSIARNRNADSFRISFIELPFWFG